MQVNVTGFAPERYSLPTAPIDNHIEQEMPRARRVLQFIKLTIPASQMIRS
jgi:hypothetical protein